MEEDLIVGKGAEGNRLSLSEILNDLRNEQGTGGEGAQGESAPQGSGEVAGDWRVYAAEGRRWRTLTGHGPDPKKVSLLPLHLPPFARKFSLMEAF